MPRNCRVARGRLVYRRAHESLDDRGARVDDATVRTPSISLAATALSALLASQTASAQTEPAVDPRVQEARDQYREGVAAFRARRFGDATVAFERSFRLRPHPTTLYNEAEARFRAGDRTEALEQLRRVIGMTDPAPDAATIERARVLAREGGIDDLQPLSPETHECPPVPQCPPQRECPVCPPPSTRPAVEHGVVPYVLAGGGLVFVAMGMTFYGYALGDAYAYNHPSNPGNVPALDTALRDQGNTFRVVGLTSLLVGVAAEVVAVYLYTHPASPPAASSGPSAQPSDGSSTPPGDRPTARRMSYPTARLDIAPSGLVLSGTF